LAVKLLEALRRGVVLGDGAIGTCLAERGYTQQPYDLANVLRPELVSEIQREYVAAGSDLIGTNTFQANRVRMKGIPADVRMVNLAGARIARDAAGPEGIVIGAIGPMGKAIEPIGHIMEDEVFEAIREQAEALAEGGVDGFILESFIDLREEKIAVDAIRSVSDLPIIASKAYIEDSEALAEGVPVRVGAEVGTWGVAAIGANCVVGPQRMIDIVRQLAEASNLPILAYPTPGLPQLVKGQITYDIAPEYFAKAAMRLVEEGATVIGGCCGTTPDHIRRMRQLLDSGTVKRRARSGQGKVAEVRKDLPESEPTRLRGLLGRKFVITVELDLPRGLNVQKVLSGAKSLKEKGADLIDISDGARARLRMNPLSISTLIQNDIGIEVMMHFACRDRNLLAIQADLLGAHALGVRNILAVTGDPANIGDYPSATSVFDVDSIGLVRILSRFNEGIDLAGYSVGAKCAFTIACAFNPLAADLDLELDRLQRKADAGAHVVYTQPIFEWSAVELALEWTEKLGLPLFVGVLPLRSSRHAEFMHNEVPGMVVPDWLRQKMAAAKDEESALELGIHEAQKLSAEIRKVAQGLYLMPPFGNHTIAERVMEAVL
jgi:homocysteine S-methyltransferase